MLNCRECVVDAGSAVSHGSVNVLHLWHLELFSVPLFLFVPLATPSFFSHHSDWNRSSKDLFHPPFKYTVLCTVDTLTAQMVYRDSSKQHWEPFCVHTHAHSQWWSKWPVQNTHKRDIKVCVWVSVRTRLTFPITWIKTNVSPLQAY